MSESVWILDARARIDTAMATDANHEGDTVAEEQQPEHEAAPADEHGASEASTAGEQSPAQPQPVADAQGEHAEGAATAAHAEPHKAPNFWKRFFRTFAQHMREAFGYSDVTPMGDDALYHDCFELILADEGVDLGIVGIVPLTARMNTLAAGVGHGEDVTRPDSLAARYGELFSKGRKPWVAVVDSGYLYDPLARELTRRGVPTFRTADRALAMLNLWLGN